MRAAILFSQFNFNQSGLHMLKSDVFLCGATNSMPSMCLKVMVENLSHVTKSQLDPPSLFMLIAGVMHTHRSSLTT